MDPDVALTRAREGIAGWMDRDDLQSALEVLEAFNDLDQWLSKGGFLPSAWLNGRGKL